MHYFIMEENQNLDRKQDLFIVYRYNINNSNTTKFIMGIYSTLEEAITRQKSLCPHYNKVLNTYSSNNGDITFVNKLNYGDSNIEMFTT